MVKEKLIHKVIVKSDPKYRDLSSRDRVKLIDEFSNPEGAKALLVDFDFSHTLRKINRRMYSKMGHIQTAMDLTHPYLKPITLDHDSEANKIIGRIVEARYVSLFDQSSQYLLNRGINPSILVDLDKASIVLDFKAVRDMLKKNGLHKDKNWIGIGKITAKTKITDQSAIERFLDGRFQTFSAETDTDMYVCSECLVDWYVDGPCEHYPMGTDQFMMTGNMVGGGSAVVTHPADDLSFVTNITFTDSMENFTSKFEDTMLVDSIQQLVIVDEQELLMNGLIKKFALDEELTLEERIKLYDYAFSLDEVKELKVIEDGKEVSVADAKLTTEQFNALPKASFIGKYRNLPVVDSCHVLVAQALVQRAESLIQDEQSSEDFSVQLTEEESKEVDWARITGDLDSQVEAVSAEARLTQEDKDKLLATDFCGPDKTFPIHNTIYIDAAKKLLETLELSDAIKAKILVSLEKKALSLENTDSIEINKKLISSLNRKAKAFGCNKSVEEIAKDAKDIKDNIDSIIASYAIEKLKTLDKTTFQNKVLDNVIDVARELGLAEDAADTVKAVNDLNEVKALLDSTKELLKTSNDSLVLSETTLADALKDRNLIDERHKAMKIEYKELYADHTNLYKELDTKNEIVDNLIDRVFKLIAVISPQGDISDKTIEKIHSILDSLDLNSLESKLNDGLTHKKVSEVENPALGTGKSPELHNDSLSAFERQQLEKYKRMVTDAGVSTANSWFDTKIKKYCSKDFHPSKFMEK